MGSTSSKIKHTSSEDVKPENIPSTPILTPEPRKKFNELDPRSPNSHISRTPLELLSATAEKLEELQDNQMYLTDDEASTKSRMILLGIDPRSPTTEFQRTPIVISAKESDLQKRIHNKNLDKVKRSTIVTTPQLTTDKKVNIIAPRLLDSSPINPKPEISKRRSLIGLLETNIDFTETNLDTVLQQKYRTQESPVEDFCTSQYISKGTQINEDLDPRSPATDFLRTPIQLIKNIPSNERKVENSHCKIKPKQILVGVDDNDLIDRIEIEKLVQEICETVQIENETDKEFIDPPITENIEPVEDAADMQDEDSDQTVTIDQNVVEIKSAPVSPPASTGKPQPLSSPFPKQTKSAPVTPPVVNITADVNELDKKLSNLIYQDDDIVVCPRIVKLKDSNNRSPLRNCNGTESERKKSIQKLRVSDKPRKIDYAVSKIPLFQEKVKNQVQCENTPPRNVENRKVKVKKPQWDNADKTLFI